MTDLETDAPVAPATFDAAEKLDHEVAPRNGATKHKGNSRLYFVRYAKPADVSVAGLDKDKDDLDARLRKLSNALAPLLEERKQLADSLSESRDNVTDLKARIDDLEMFLNPFQAEKRAAIEDRNAQKQQRADQRAAELNAKQKRKNDFNSTYGQLGVTNDAEIDAKLNELEYKQQHESLSIQEEKLIIKQIKQLQDSREPIREHGEWLAQEKMEREFRTAEGKKRRGEPAAVTQQANGHARPAISAEEEKAQKEREVMSQMKQQCDELWENYKQHLDQKKTLLDNDKTLKADIDKLIKDRDALRKEREDVWAKLQKQKSESRSASKPYTQNRNFSAKVRDLVKAGEIEEAQRLCKEQMEEVLNQYKSDVEFRKEYNQMWDSQVDYRRPLAMYQADSFHSTAASVIAEALEAAKRKLANKQSSAQNGTAQSSPKKSQLPVSKQQTSKPRQLPDESEAVPSETFQAAKPTIIPGMESDGAIRPKPKKAKKAKSSAPLVELPVIEQEEFIPPPSARKSEVKEVSEKERKEQEKERNRLAQVEAALRKERRRQAQEKKKVLKAQKAEQSTNKKQSSAASEVSEEANGPDTPPAQDARPLENGYGPTSSDEAATQTFTDNTKHNPRGAARSNKQIAKIAATPKLRPKKKATLSLKNTLRQYSRTAWSVAEEQPAAVAAGAFVLLATGVISSIVYFAA